MISAANGRGRNARAGTVIGLDPRTGKVLWTFGNWQCIIPVPQAVDAGQGRVLVTGGYVVSGIFRNPDFGPHAQPPLLHDGHFYTHYTITEPSDGLVAMSMDGKVKWKTGQQPPFVRRGSVLADGLMIVTGGNTKLYLVEPSPTACKPLASAVIPLPGWPGAPLRPNPHSLRQVHSASDSCSL